MADKASFESYKSSGFYEASGAEGLQGQVQNVPTGEEALRKQAVDQYSDTYKRLDSSLSKQITSLITSQATDEKLLNEQYNNSISSMMAQLQKRGLHVTPSLPQAQTAAINKHRNDTMNMRADVYRLQRAIPEQRKKLLEADYEKAIAQRVAANRETNIPTTSDLLVKISDLQNAGYLDYLNDLLAKKSGGGGGGRRYSSSSPGDDNDTYTPPKIDLSGYDAVLDTNYTQAHQHFVYASGK